MFPNSRYTFCKTNTGSRYTFCKTNTGSRYIFCKNKKHSNWQGDVTSSEFVKDEQICIEKYFNVYNNNSRTKKLMCFLKIKKKH